MSNEQPAPVPNDRPAVWDLVIEDMRARDALGRARYGTRLQAGNGRDALRDAYEEALDLAVYLRQAIEERCIAEWVTWVDRQRLSPTSPYLAPAFKLEELPVWPHASPLRWRRDEDRPPQLTAGLPANPYPAPAGKLEDREGYPFAAPSRPAPVRILAVELAAEDDGA